jgi:hypothetical protein
MLQNDSEFAKGGHTSSIDSVARTMESRVATHFICILCKFNVNWQLHQFLYRWTHVTLLIGSITCVLDGDVAIEFFLFHHSTTSSYPVAFRNHLLAFKYGLVPPKIHNNRIRGQKYVHPLCYCFGSAYLRCAQRTHFCFSRF